MRTYIIIFVIELYTELKFSANKYSFKENSGSATIVLILSKPVLSGFYLTITSTALTSDKSKYICTCISV